tara:strand:+ start:2100 stop:2372 length:273 start_codon:yes stop_codon:yes gene_type:complete
MAPYEPPRDAHYTELDVSEYPDDFMWYAVGREGKNFYDITTWLKLKYLWYDESRKVVEIWGPHQVLVDGAKNKIKNVINMYAQIKCANNN